MERLASHEYFVYAAQFIFPNMMLSLVREKILQVRTVRDFQMEWMYHFNRRVIEATPGLVLLDEAYREFNRQDLSPLVRDYDNVVMPVTWQKRYGAGRVFYCSLGHSADVLALAPVLTMVRRGLAWAAK